MLKEQDNRHYAVFNEDYLWEESFGDEKGFPRRMAPHTPETGIYGFNSAAVLQDMLGDDPAAKQPDPAAAAAAAKTPPTPPRMPFIAPMGEETPPDLPEAPLMQIVTDKQEEPVPSYRESMVHSLLQLAEEAERQASMAADAANTANMLAQELISNMQLDGSRSFQQLSLTACKNAYFAAEVAVQAQISALQTHAAAVNQSLADLEAAKDSMQLRSQDIIQLSMETADKQQEATLAREKAERARLEYTAKQNAALSSHDILAQAKRDYDLNQTNMRQSHKNLEVAQQKASQAHLEYMQLKNQLEERRKQWQSIQKMQLWMPENEIQRATSFAPPLEQPLTQPLAQPPLQPLAQPSVQPPAQTEIIPPASAPGPVAASGPGPPRNQVAAIPFATPPPQPPAFAVEPQPAIAETIPLATPPPPQPPAFAAEPQPAIAGIGALEQALPAVEPATAPAEVKEARGSRLWLYTKILAAALAVVLCLRVFVFDVVLVEGVSMVPTLYPTDSLISSKIAYKLQDPQRYDIILLDAPDESGYYIKRLIGLPNEHIQIMDGQVFINGTQLQEEYLNNISTDGEINTVIPNGYYFVMGDNRSASRDSRTESIGLIAEEHINGKAIFRFYPLKTMKLL